MIDVGQLGIGPIEVVVEDDIVEGRPGLNLFLGAGQPLGDDRVAVLRPGLEPAPKIIALNRWIKEYAAQHGAIFVDFHSAMADGAGGMRAGLSSDGVHPNEAGYRIMATLAEPAIEQALRSK